MSDDEYCSASCNYTDTCTDYTKIACQGGGDERQLSYNLLAHNKIAQLWKDQNDSDNNPDGSKTCATAVAHALAECNGDSNCRNCCNYKTSFGANRS